MLRSSLLYALAFIDVIAALPFMLCIWFAGSIFHATFVAVLCWFGLYGPSHMHLSVPLLNADISHIACSCNSILLSFNIQNDVSGILAKSGR